jgi:hypothetical protein
MTEITRCFISQLSTGTANYDCITSIGPSATDLHEGICSGAVEISTNLAAHQTRLIAAPPLQCCLIVFEKLSVPGGRGSGLSANLTTETNQPAM